MNTHMNFTETSIPPAKRKYPFLYQRWAEMRYRCSVPGHKLYKWYGARGISVCDRWQSYKVFYADMFPSYTKGMHLDRIDNDKGYSLENCRWATCKQNARNKRNNRIIDTPLGPMVLSAAAEHFGVKFHTLRMRIKVNMSQERVFNKKTHERAVK